MNRISMMFLAPLLALCGCKTVIPELDPTAIHDRAHLSNDEFRQHVLMFDARGQMRDPIVNPADPHIISSRSTYPRLLNPDIDDYTSEPILSPVGDIDAYIDNIIAGVDAQRA